VVCNFQLHFCRRRSTTSEPPLNALELKATIVALDAVDIVGTVKRYDEWLGPGTIIARDSLRRYFFSRESSKRPSH
jgi:hypothetical protein